MMRSFAACHVADQKSIIHTVTLVHCLVLFHGMTTLILEIDCVAFREQRLHVHLWPAKGMGGGQFVQIVPNLFAQIVPLFGWVVFLGGSPLRDVSSSKSLMLGVVQEVSAAITRRLAKLAPHIGVHVHVGCSGSFRCM